MGLFTLEQCVYLEGNQYTPRGQLFTTGPGTYKIPSSSDIPVQLNVSLMDRTPNPKAIFSSKVMKQSTSVINRYHNMLSFVCLYSPACAHMNTHTIEYTTLLSYHFTML